MGKRVILTILEGSFEQGFPVILRFSDDVISLETKVQIVGKLPNAANLLELLINWQLAYRQTIMPYCRIKAKPIITTNISCRQLGFDLVTCLNNWLNSTSKEWQKIRDGLQRNLLKTDEIEFIIQTNDKQLRQLPWHLWNLLDNYSKAEVVLSAPEYQLAQTLKNTKNKVKILAIFGNSQGIDLSQDEQFLKQLLDKAEIKFLVEPPLEVLNDRLWEEGWDILFFAGHSSSTEQGQILLNETDKLTIAQLKYALKKAISNGLRLAIFNSCEGLDLAQHLYDLHLPHVIVMREPVPDKVAQTFLKDFLTAFSKGQSLFASVREARERLEKLEAQYPYASWLPIICQNPAVPSLTWTALCGIQRNSTTFSKPLIASIVTTIAVLSIRSLGLLQAWELQAFDWFIRARPQEPQDSRILVVTITENDFQIPEQAQRKGSLSDLALAKLLDKLEPYQPRAIGLDIYRDYPVNLKQSNLNLKNYKNFFAICKVSDHQANHPGITPPPEVPIERLGFSDVVKDPDGILRRHLIAMQPPPSSPCITSYAFSSQLALYYLKTEGIGAKYTPNEELQIGDVTFNRLHKFMGGYQNVDTWGYQILLNYRSYRSPLEIAPTVTLTDVLADKVKPDDIKDRIVLIGVTAQSAHDFLSTPYSGKQSFSQEMPGIIVQAQMISQILSAVKDKRQLLSVLPIWGDVVWVWGWSLLGGLLVGYSRSRVHLLLLGSATLGVLVILSWILFIQGIWVPLVPSILVMIVTGSSIIIYEIANSN